MSERTEEDERIDEAIELLIDDDTDGFSLVAHQGEDVHLVEGAKPDQQMLAVWILVQQIRRQASSAGTPLRPVDVLAGAVQIAQERGYLDENASIRDVSR